MIPEPPFFGFLGEALALVSAILFALSNIFILRGSVRASGDNGALLSVLVTVLVSGTLWLALSGEIPTGGGGGGLWGGLAWFAMAGLLATVFGRIFLWKSIQRLGVTRASAIKRLNPFFSVVLAALVLGEVITPLMGAGMALIAVSFGTLIRGTVRSLWSRGGAAASGEGHLPADYLYGPASALCYATSYIGRRYGLDRIPDAVFGTFVAAIAALGYYAIASIFVRDYRRAFREALSGANRWQLAAAVAVSFGQIANFGAIQFTAVSKVVMITSMEIFISMFLAVIVFKTEKPPEPTTILAAFMATAGVTLVALG
jgi:drug/metabolite transporter (DMT)-like permease